MHRRVGRVLLPAVVLLLWLAVSAIGGPYFGRISQVASNDQTTFLPASAEATEVQRLLPPFSGPGGPPAIVLLVRASGLTAEDRQYASDLATVASRVPGVATASPPALSRDGQAIQFVAVPNPTAAVEEVVTAIRSRAATPPTGLDVYVTGPAGFVADLTAAFSGIDGLLLGVAMAAVFLILLLVYRSPLLPVLVLGTAVFALSGSIVAVWWLAKAGILTINGQVQGILFILVIGAATDYSLLYVSRYREALRDVRTGWEATVLALRASAAPIVASGATVAAGLLSLLLSDLNSNKALGPVATIGIFLSLLASLTLLPALLLVFRRAAFWPLRPRFGSPHPVLVGEGVKGIWPRVGGAISRRPRAVWTICAVALIAGSTGLLGLRASGVAQSELILGASESRDGQTALGQHFPGGLGSPAIIIGPTADLTRLVSAATGTPGVRSVAVVVKGHPRGTVDVTPETAARTAQVATTVDGRVALQATLDPAPDSTAAEQAVLHLRDRVRTVSPTALVGGATATVLDTNAAALRDRLVVIPVVLTVIVLILMLLLRSVVAAVLLVGTVILSFGAALGISSTIFNTIFNFPGADASVPLYAFVFLVALGVDYNIFLMTRVREEALRHGTRAGILRGLSATGGVISSAGIVLAATFAALAVLPILFLVQLAFLVAFGVLLDTLMVRSLLVPALSYDLGPRVWWPGRLRVDGLAERRIEPARPQTSTSPWPRSELPSAKTEVDGE